MAKFALLLSIVSVLTFSACGGGGGGSTSAPGPGPSATITVTITPPAASLLVGETRQFSASITGSSNQGVTWTVDPATAGLIDGTGRFVAGSQEAACRVVATSQADTSKSAFAPVVITKPEEVTVTVAPASVALEVGKTAQFTSTVTGAGSSTVTWTVEPSTAGAVDAAGRFTAGDRVANCFVRATSQAKPTFSGTALVTITPNTTGGLANISIEPGGALLTAGGRLDLKATLVGLTQTGVNWTSNGGTITADASDPRKAAFSAPNALGPVKITATSQADALVATSMWVEVVATRTTSTISTLKLDQSEQLMAARDFVAPNWMYIGTFTKGSSSTGSYTDFNGRVSLVSPVPLAFGFTMYTPSTSLNLADPPHIGTHYISFAPPKPLPPGKYVFRFVSLEDPTKFADLVMTLI